MPISRPTMSEPLANGMHRRAIVVRRHRSRPPAAWTSLCILLCSSALACSGPPSSVVEVDDSGAGDHDALPPSDMPNLIIDGERLLTDLAIEERFFDETACELHPDEACITSPGNRRLLRFSVETPNVGGADLVVGEPGEPFFQYSDCHGHQHFSGFAAYELEDAAGGQMASGHKQAFCLVDTRRYVDAPTTPEDNRFNCNFQGIQRGWSDVYDSRLACQFIDITDIPDGPYKLRVRINTERLLEEASYDDNSLELDIDLSDPALSTPIEQCPPDGGHPTRSLSRECGWSFVGTFACVPGRRLSVGCADDCALGSCTGDPMLRVCASGRADGNCSHGASLGRGDNACGTSCPQASNIECPLSAGVDVYAGSHDPTQPFTCNVAIREL